MFFNVFPTDKITLSISYQPGGTEFEPLPHHLAISLTCFIIGNWLHHSADVQVHIGNLVITEYRPKPFAEIFCPSCPARSHHGRVLLPMSEPKLPWGDDDLWLLCQHGPSPPLLVVSLDVAGHRLVLPLLPLLAGQGPLHVQIPSVVSVHRPVRSVPALLRTIIRVHFIFF